MDLTPLEPESPTPSAPAWIQGRNDVPLDVPTMKDTVALAAEVTQQHEENCACWQAGYEAGRRDAASLASFDRDITDDPEDDLLTDSLAERGSDAHDFDRD